MRRPIKKACDECIARKVKCSGTWPCDACRQSSRRVDCTFLKPVGRRGPKVRRLEGRARSVVVLVGTGLISSDQDAAESCNSVLSMGLDSVAWVDCATGQLAARDGPVHRNHTAAPSAAVDTAFYENHTSIPLAVLSHIVHLYQQSSYSVWPIINAPALLQKLESIPDVDILRLAMALSAATMAQLQLPPLLFGDVAMDCTTMAAECMKLRDANPSRERLDLRSILVSFFLHVYHAKRNRRKSAMGFIQQAISGAERLGLNAVSVTEQVMTFDEVIANKEVLFLLLWISERGYAMHLGLQPSYTCPIVKPDFHSCSPEVQGLLELGQLFATFDMISTRHRDATTVTFAGSLAATEAALSGLSLSQQNGPTTRVADYCITKEWMRTIIWQKALSQRLLSSTSCVDLMTFRFPAVVGRALLCSLQGFSESDLLPLGRDQVSLFRA
ncbi:putative C6 transcription factor [Aspergillus saccharolyticus JOP 1030-1]|uniref:Zn(2)-C6 fungal-type domain-containing protein n=1 Tax=Aspergillus saccharolyticus JOP 1030-1 TaxID=1450539 RepID=A0A318ZY36_9EURO|nr:hypothetical protein BP01DRAFT_391968 [Aspergillus saccharolyticus JOP 1030-1]PYH45018.1 hypothetical protein BP01DRAFT_391968 [Aspergillus saccharolyticus JOP 1030-1]